MPYSGNSRSPELKTSDCANGRFGTISDQVPHSVQPNLPFAIHGLACDIEGRNRIGSVFSEPIRFRPDLQRLDVALGFGVSVVAVGRWCTVPRLVVATRVAVAVSRSSQVKYAIL